jgi:hypothetical protein
MLLSGLCFAPGALAQTDRQPDAATISVQEAASEATKTGKPLIVLGTSATCSRCQALKQGLSSNPELKLLLTQYVTVEVPFAGREFKEAFQAIVARDKKFNQPIGAPSVFLFTAAGETVYAGPNQASGMAAGDELKKLLIEGIGKNGGVRSPALEFANKSSAEQAADLRQARKLLSEKQVVPAALLVARHIQPAAESDEQIAAVVKLTGLPLAKSNSEAELDALVKQLSGPGQSLVQAALAQASSGDATRGAVQLAELDRAFGKFPALAEPLAAAWKETEAKANVPQLREQAELIDKARAAESEQDLPRAIAAYEEVVATYPGTQAAELSQQRLKQLKPAADASPREWKSKDGKFSVTARLVSFDGVTARLLTTEGKTIDVKIAALSAEDQAHLSAAKRVQ